MGGGGVARPCLYLTSAAPLISYVRVPRSSSATVIFVGGVYSWVINPSWVLPLL
jgi:hypothetical protein